MYIFFDVVLLKNLKKEITDAEGRIITLHRNTSVMSQSTSRKTEKKANSASHYLHFVREATKNYTNITLSFNQLQFFFVLNFQKNLSKIQNME